MVNAALDRVPDPFAAYLPEVVVLIEDYNPDNPDTLGLFEGTPLPHREFDHSGFLPDAIFIYRGALMDAFPEKQELASEVEVTLFHELGHFFGIEEDRLHELGWG